MTRIKGIVLGLASLIVISILIVTWVYPFSLFSVHKSYTYTPDSFEVDGYVKKLNDFKNSYGENPIDDVTTKLTPSILQMFEQDWLVNKDSVSMNKDELDSILFYVKNARETLLRLTIQEKYTSEQRRYLLDCIKNMLSLEETIDSIQNDKWEASSTLHTEFHNLYMGFFNSFNMFVSFYEISHHQ